MRYITAKAGNGKRLLRDTKRAKTDRVEIGAAMNETGGKIGIKAAVKAGWASKPTIYRAIKDGRLSVDRAVPGRQLLDVSELVRVFGEPAPRDNAEIKAETNPLAARLAELERETAVLQERLRSAEKERDSLAQARQEAVERESWLRGQIDSQARLLASSGQKTGFWGRVFGKGPGKTEK